MPFTTLNQTPETLVALTHNPSLLISVGAFYGAAVLSVAARTWGWRVARTFCVGVA